MASRPGLRGRYRILIGLPGSTWSDLERDLETVAALDPDMIGVGPFIAHADTPLAAAPPGEVPSDVLLTHRVLATLRLACPRTNIAATTALGVLGGDGARTLALLRGANVLMPNFTPDDPRQKYQIYPGKEDAEPFRALDLLEDRLARAGVVVARGPGTSPRFLSRGAAEPCSPTSVD
ncbi:MAG: hypothetical protein HC923_09440 [Myxococcales bacterium]|nr:hypothetical protein [Myxococcales bacterium]